MLWTSDISLINKLNRNGARWEPWKIPELILIILENELLNLTI